MDKFFICISRQTTLRDNGFKVELLLPDKALTKSAVCDWRSENIPPGYFASA